MTASRGAAEIIDRYLAHQPACQGRVVTYEPISLGLINSTWRVLADGQPCFLLQQINTDVFKDPHAIDSNIRALQRFADGRVSSSLPRPFPHLVTLTEAADESGDRKKDRASAEEQAEEPDQRTLITTASGCYRVFEYIRDSHSVTAPSSAEQAYEAAKQFGYFTAFFQGMDPVGALQVTIPAFHDLRAKYEYFEKSLVHGLPDRIAHAAQLIAEVQELSGIMATYCHLMDNAILPVRVIHHDAKIANMLFDSDDKGMCCVDLDTVMPGYFMSDLGDLLRTSLCEHSEEQTDLSLIAVRMDYFEAVLRGYLMHMGELLTVDEQKYLVYAGEFIIFMQAIRFLTDYLLGDVYYKFNHGLHNYDRACNQMQLLRSYQSQSQAMHKIIDSIVARKG